MYINMCERQTDGGREGEMAEGVKKESITV